MDLSAGADDEMRRMVVDALIDSENEPAPPPLRQKVLAGALRSRPAGRPVAVAEPIAPVEAYRRTVEDLSAVLAGLAPASWAAVVVPYGWTVQGLVGHVLGIERLLGARLGVDDLAVPGSVDLVDADHLLATEDVVAAQSVRPPADTLAEWRAAADRVLAALAGPAAPDMDDRVSFHGVSYRWSSLLVARSLEVWTHTDDIRRALGQPLATPEASRLALMTDLAARTLPLRLALTSEAASATGTVRLVLTGPGGGVWVESLPGADGAAGPAGGDAEPDVRIVADAVGFCRLSAGRLSAAELGATVEGDASLGAAVFTASAAFAV